jgi:hypothetical protein
MTAEHLVQLIVNFVNESDPKAGDILSGLLSPHKPDADQGASASVGSANQDKGGNTFSLGSGPDTLVFTQGEAGNPSSESTAPDRSTLNDYKVHNDFPDVTIPVGNSESLILIDNSDAAFVQFHSVGGYKLAFDLF